MRGFEVSKRHGCFLDVLSGAVVIAQRELASDVVLTLHGLREESAAWTAPMLAP